MSRQEPEVGQAYGIPDQSHGRKAEMLDRAYEDGIQDSEPGSAPRRKFDHPAMQAAYADGWRRAQEELR